MQKFVLKCKHYHKYALCIVLYQCAIDICPTQSVGESNCEQKCEGNIAGEENKDSGEGAKKITWADVAKQSCNKLEKRGENLPFTRLNDWASK